MPIGRSAELAPICGRFHASLHGDRCSHFCYTAIRRGRATIAG